MQIVFSGVSRAALKGLARGCAGLALAVSLVAAARGEDLSVTSAHRYEMAPNASGFFIGLDGTVLTARHAVDGGGALFVLKDGQVARAALVATSDAADLAVIRSAIKPPLVAVFAAGDRLSANQPVFAAGYDELRHLKDRATLMYNGFALDRQTEPSEVEIALFSGATHGASGSPVLAGNGLVIGLIAKREAGAVGAGEVVAVSVGAIKAFLTGAGIAFQDSDQAQVSPLQARAPRASTLTVGVICG